MCVCFAQFTCFAQTHQQIFPINLPFFRITSNYSLCTKVQIILFAFGNSDRSDQQQLCKLFQANKYYSKFDKCSFVALFAASRISRLWQLFSCLSQDSQLFANSTRSQIHISETRNFLFFGQIGVKDYNTGLQPAPLLQTLHFGDSRN